MSSHQSPPIKDNIFPVKSLSYKRNSHFHKKRNISSYEYNSENFAHRNFSHEYQNFSDNWRNARNFNQYNYYNHNFDRRYNTNYNQHYHKNNYYNYNNWENKAEEFSEDQFSEYSYPEAEEIVNQDLEIPDSEYNVANDSLKINQNDKESIKFDKLSNKKNKESIEIDKLANKNNNKSSKLEKLSNKNDKKSNEFDKLSNKNDKESNELNKLSNKNETNSTKQLDAVSSSSKSHSVSDNRAEKTKLESNKKVIGKLSPNISKFSDTTIKSSIKSTSCDENTNNKKPNCNSECDKYQERKVVTERISHLINPVNAKDKAEVDKLMTEYYKSKKKENLIKLKHHYDNDESDKDNIEGNVSLFQKLNHLQEKNDISNSLEVETVQSGGVDILNQSNTVKTKPSPKSKKRKKSSLSESSLSDNNNKLLNHTNSPATLSTSISSDSETSNKAKKFHRKSRSSTDSAFPINKLLFELPTNVNSEDIILEKRSNSFSQNSKSKKHKCSALECLEKCLHETENSQDQHFESIQNDSETYNKDIYVNEELCMKQESSEIPNLFNLLESHPSDTLEVNISNSKILNVEDLVKIFAVKNVTIKKEFDDPLIDAIKNVDMDVLLNACSQPEEIISHQPTSSNITNKVLPSIGSPINFSCNASQQSTDLSNSNNKSSLDNNTQQQSSDLSNCTNKSSFENSAQQQSNSILLSREEVKQSAGLSLNEKCTSKTETFESSFPGLKPFNVYVNISNELKKLQKEEDRKIADLKEIDNMIQNYQKILNELNAKKIKLQTEEDNLRSRRNGLTCALSQCVTQDSFSSLLNNQLSNATSSKTASVSPELNNALIVVSQISNDKDEENNSDKHDQSTQLQNNFINNCFSTPISNIVLDTHSKPSAEDSDIVIIPKPDMHSTEIPVIDIDLDFPERKNSGDSRVNLAFNFYEKKSLCVHETVVNSLKVWNDFLYTCSNDYTAKRFNLKDYSHIVIYKHSRRNVLELCVEIFNDNTLVFTLCSADKCVASFTAENGVPLKSYGFDVIISSISNGWGKIFAGLKTGLIMIINPKESKELVRNLEPIKNIACTMQGGIHVLIVLSSTGQVAVRDVDRNGLLIRYIRTSVDIPLFMNVYHDLVYLSSSVYLTSTDLSNGALVHKIKLTSPITGLAAYENNIFTTSFSGLVRCYPDGKFENLKMAYGAGNNSLTCIYVYQGWVFTGNRNGEAAVFKFDPATEFICKYNKCCYVFSRMEDLETHVLSGVDHKVPQKLSKCPWRGCHESIRDHKDRKYHLRQHIRCS